MAQVEELPAPVKKKSKLKWIVLLFLLLVLGGGGFGAYKLGFLDRFLGKDHPQAEQAAKEAEAASAAQASKMLSAKLDPFLVNLADPLGNRYIQMTVEIEVVAPSVLGEIQAQTPKIRDSLIMLLSSKTQAELSTADGSGKLLLKNEILDRINQILGGSKITNVFFIDFRMM